MKKSDREEEKKGDGMRRERKTSMRRRDSAGTVDTTKDSQIQIHRETDKNKRS